MQQPGKRSQLFVGEETSYGVQPTLATSHFMRHISAALDFDPYNRVYTPEKKAAPGQYVIFDRRGTAAGNVEGLIRPSGTINTVPECTSILKAAFGSIVNTALSTTVASGGGSSAVSGVTLTSAAGQAVGNPLLITCPDGKKRVRFTATVNTGTGAVTWVPQLPAGQGPSNGAAVKAGILYKLTSANAISLFLARYTLQADFTAGLGELLTGWMVDRLALNFDWQEEPRFTASGPAQLKADAGSNPGTVQVGTNPPTAITGEAMISNTPIKLMKLAFELTNGLIARSDQLGDAYPTEAYRMGSRDISLGLDMYGENDFKTAIYDVAMAGTLATVFHQVGFTEGKIIGVYAPRVEFKPPTVNVPDGAVMWPFKGRVLEGTEDANNELWLGLC